MKEKLFSLLILIVLIHISQLYLSWWTIAVPALILGLIVVWPVWQTFALTLLAVAIYTAIYTIWINHINDGIIAGRISSLFNEIGTGTLIIITALAMGLLAGTAAGLGASLKQTIKQNSL